MKPCLALDLDATLVQYDHSEFDIGYVGELIVDDDGVSAREFMYALASAGYELHVYSARATRPEGEAAIWRWIREEKLDDVLTGVTARKEFFFHRFVDDRAIAFKGRYGPILEALGVRDSKPQEFWVVGRVDHADRGHWEFQGLFDTEADAVAACTGKLWFVMPVALGVALPARTIQNARAYYPLDR